jgi:hypothetical protein
MSDESNWQNEVDSPQRSAASNRANERRYGRVEVPDPEDLSDD